MTILLALAGGVIALVAAARSTWSPCGLSMLATITPLAEQGRGHRYRATARWFVLGSLIGGSFLGAGMALLAGGVATTHASTSVLGAIAAAAALITLASDARLGGFQLPVHHRQVNERWLDQFRPWVYGAGFGWQIGAGLATYIRTCAVYLMIVLAALTGSPTTAVIIGVAFGLVRGLAVYLGRHITSSVALADFHRRFTAAGPIALAAVVACEAVVALTFSTVVSVWLGGVVAALLTLTVIEGAWRRRQLSATTSREPSVTIR